MPEFNPMMLVNMFIGNNPELAATWKQAQQMASGKSPEELQQLATNLCGQRGISMESIKNQMSNFGIKL